LTFNAFRKAEISAPAKVVLMLIYSDPVELAAGIEQEFRRGCHTGGFRIVMASEPPEGDEP
jgi:hypothetical protein